MLNTVRRSKYVMYIIHVSTRQYVYIRVHLISMQLICLPVERRFYCVLHSYRHEDAG